MAPLHEGIRPEKDPSSSLSYSALAIARSMYSLRMKWVAILASIRFMHYSLGFYKMGMSRTLASSTFFDCHLDRYTTASQFPAPDLVQDLSK
jgi:hypothetical protein